MPEDTGKRVQIAFYGSEDYRNWLQDEARKRRIKVQQLLDEAVDSYLKQREPDAAETMVMPVPENALADFELEEDILNRLESEGRNLPPETKRAMARQLREAMTGNDPSVAAVEFTPVAGRAELVSAKPHLQFEGIPELASDPAITPQNEHERTVVQSVLAFERDPNLPAEFREILYVLLRRWVPDSYKAGKKTA